MKYLLGILLAAIIPLLSAQAQSLRDGVFMNPQSLCTGFGFQYDSWSDYWEGTLKRSNGNIGTVSTSSVALMGAYGLIEDLNVVVMLPYVWTSASAGTLTGMSGIQDLTVGAKYRAFDTEIADGTLSVNTVVSGSIPIGNYSPDFLPLSIGLATQTLTGRVMLHYIHDSTGLYATVSGAYTGRSNVTLDRPSYYDDGVLHYSNEVPLADVTEFYATIGYDDDILRVEGYFHMQNTVKGSDIRRQDMPFVANRMNFSKVGVMTQYRMSNWLFQLNGDYTLAGRNVGQSLATGIGIFYTFTF